MVIIQHNRFAHVYAATTPVNRAGYGRGTGTVLIDDLACTPFESRLIDCRGRFGSSNCNHGEDAGVICVPEYTPGPGMQMVVSNEINTIVIINFNPVYLKLII